MCSQSDCYKVILLMIFLLFENVDSRSTKIKFQSNSVQNVRNQLLRGAEKNTTANEKGRGLILLAGGLLSLGKVLNFFPVGGERECQPDGHNIAKAGICINQYDCRQRDGRASGDCAHGLGVCCVFEVSCGAVVQNNLTYFMSPGFPELWVGDQDCNIVIEKTYAGIMQLRIDFLHFTLGQPNRTTGECDEDAMILGDGDSNFTLCGQNHGQHIYYTLSTATEKKEWGELAGTKSINLSMRMRGSAMPRLWLLRIAQMPLAYTSPHECLQYFTSDNGTISTFNYASNGRHLASQNYKSCIRKNTGFCSIRYAPCDTRSFRIGPAAAGGTPSSSLSGMPAIMNPVGTQDDDQMMPVNGADQMMPGDNDEQMMPGDNDEQMMPGDDNDQMMPGDDTQDDDMEGSGNEPAIQGASAEPGVFNRIWTYIWSWMWGQARSVSWWRWSPYTQHNLHEDDKYLYYGYGNNGFGSNGYGRQRCQDRITIPCENEYFLSKSYLGVCDPHHCGNTFCPGEQYENCRVETSISPFAVSVNFGPPTVKASPEDNIGMCLRYNQIPCDA